ncbi:MAG: cell wall biosynthesis glycosyltransferase [Opitutaceae bacterium]|nr:cell wall biosynthesis glycosyltransferase [Opitutaceae bacterium]|tara:strand:+ start:1363 stop:2133 length:771 start_codon:yes stop_codon:yes gene_type:complete
MPGNLNLLSVIIPAKDEGENLIPTISNLRSTLSQAAIPFEILIVDDYSKDNTQALLAGLSNDHPEIRSEINSKESGFGNAIQEGFKHMQGDAAVIFMADESDSPKDVAVYWNKLNEGHDCVFGSRFNKKAKVIDYPIPKLLLNRLANKFIQVIFGIRLNDTTNAFKAYRKEVIDGCQPLLSPHFNLTVELPLKAIIRGYSWSTVPTTWQNRKRGTAKFKIKEMGSRYLFIIFYAWLEKFFSRGDYHRSKNSSIQRN